MPYAIDTVTVAGRKYATRRFRTATEVNIWLSKNAVWGVIAAFPGRIHCARLVDRGVA